MTALGLRLDHARDRLSRLTDVYLDRAIERELFEERKTALLLQRPGLDDRLTWLKNGGVSFPDAVAEFLELAGSASLLYEMDLPEEKRDLLTIVTSNRTVQGKTLGLTLAPPFDAVATRFQSKNGAPYRDRPRTLDQLIEEVIERLKGNPAPPSRRVPSLSSKSSSQAGTNKREALAP